MNNLLSDSSTYNKLSDPQFEEIDALSDRFERELVSSKSPRIETYLRHVAHDIEADLLVELLATEVEFRAANGDEPQRDEYLQRFPGYKRVVARIFHHRLPLGNLDSNRCTGKAAAARITSAPPKIPGFRVTKELGRGGMGVVWLAEQLEPVNRRVAVKLIGAGLTTKPTLARFEAEKQALAIMHHPHIARLFDAGTMEDGRPYFVMELVDGVPINNYCDENKLSVDERLKLFVTVCKAVQHAHQKGIIHRDLKPSNVLVTEVDGEAVPKVIDFGLAKTIDHHRQLSDLTMQTEIGKVVGTVQYMSPEQAELKGIDADTVDTRTDVYSLGVMLYELLTGSTPVDKKTLADHALLQILEMVREQDPPRPSRRLTSSSHRVNSSVSNLRRMQPARLQKLLQGELDWVVMRALEKSPDRRYQTAKDLAQDLSNYLTGETVTARPPSTWYQMQKFANRNRGLMMAMLAIGVALLAGIAGTTYGLIRAQKKTELAETKTREAEANEKIAVLERSKAEVNERRAVAAEDLAAAEAERVRDSEAAAKFQLAVARWKANRAVDARRLLHEIAPEYRDTFEWHLCKRRFQGSDVTCYGHTSPVYEVAFTRDGKRIVSAGDTGIIRVWDAVTGEQLSTLEGHEEYVEGLDVSPDGSRIVSASQDRTLKVWAADSGELIHTLSGHEGGINCVVFSPTGDRIASASDDSTIKLWNPATGEELSTISGHTGRVSGIAFSPNGGQIASTSDRDQTVRVWDSHTGEEIATVRRNREFTRRLAFSPDGSRLLTVSYGRWSMWDTATWQLTAEERYAHERIVHCIAFSPDGDRFATGGEDATVRLWETNSGRLLSTLTGHAKTVWGVAFSHGGSRLASASSDETVKIWEGFGAAGGNELKLTGHSGGGCRVVFSADDRLVATGGYEGRIILRDAQTNDVLQTLDGHVGMVGGLAFNSEGTFLASGGDDRTVRLWDTQSGEALAVMNGHTSWVRGLAFSPDGTQVATAGWDGTARLWDPVTHEEIETLKGHRGGLYHVAFSVDGAMLATASSDRTVKLWDTRTRQEIRTFRGHVGPVRAVAFDPRAERLVSAGHDAKIRIWDIASGKQLATANRRSAKIFALALSPNGKRIATTCTDLAIHLYDAQTAKEIMSVSSQGGLAATFSRDGTRLAVAGGGPTPSTMANIQILDAPRQHETNVLTGHTGEVAWTSFSRDGSRVYSMSESEKLVWDVESCQQIPDALWKPPEATIRTSADGRWFVRSESNSVVLVDLLTKNLLKERGYRVKASLGLHNHWDEPTKVE